MWPTIIKYFTSSDPHHDISWWGWHRYQQRNTNDVPSGDPLKFYSTWSCILFGVSSGILCRYLLAVYLANLLSGILSCISSGTLSAILSGISSSILSGIYFGVLFYLAYILAFYVAFFLAYILAFYVAFYVAYILAVYLAYILAVFLAYFLAFHLAAEVQRCPVSLGSEGPWLRSSGAHCAQNLAVEVQPCPIRSEAGCWGPAVPTARGSWRRAKSWQGGSGRGSGGRGGGGEGGRRGGQGGAGTAVIKSNNRHLAGGEQ